MRQANGAAMLNPETWYRWHVRNAHGGKLRSTRIGGNTAWLATVTKILV